MTEPINDKKSRAKLYTALYVILLICLFFPVYYFVFDSKPALNGDNFSYLNLSENIVNGHGYSTTSVDGTYQPANWFPPGYPYLLAGLKLILGDNVRGLKVVNGLLFLGSILLFFLFVKKITRSTSFAFSVAVLLVLNPSLLRLSTIIMSEIPYLFFTVLAFYAVSRLDEKEHTEAFWKTHWYYVTVIASILSFYIRGMGIVLIGAVAVHWLSRKRWKLTGAYLIGNSILYLPYQIRNILYGLKGRYIETIFVENPWRPETGQISTVSGFGEKIITNLNDTIIHGFPQVLVPSLGTVEPVSVLTILGIFVLLISGFGIWKIKKYRILLYSYFLFNIGVLLLWHPGNGVRYVWPLAGFISLSFFYGLLKMITLLFSTKSEARAFSISSFAILIVGFFLFPSIKFEASKSIRDYPSPYRNYIDLAKYIGLLENSDSIVVACRKPEMFSYFANCRTSTYLYSLDDKEVVRQLVETDADYVVVEQLGYSSTARYLYPAIQKNKDLFKVEMQLRRPDTFLYLFDKTRAKEVLQTE